MQLHISSHKSVLYHTEAIADRLVRILRNPVYKDPAGLEVFVRLDHDDCTVSIDTSGPPLHERGWRLATAKAPLRPTLAAAVLRESGWQVGQPLFDPLCGAGTIAIEAALMAAGRAPNPTHDFAFLDWPSFEPGTWASVKATLTATAADKPSTTGATDIATGVTGIAAAGRTIVASDRDGGAVEAARANADRAGVAHAIDFEVRALSAAPPPAAVPGWIISNPPYGRRVQSNRDLRDLYATIGNLARGPYAGWGVALLAAEPALAQATRLRFDEVLQTKNGGIAVTLYRRAPS